jgi:hypothetical protein
MHAKNNRQSRPHRSKRVFWFDLGRLLFPDLINKPKEMQARMLVVTFVLATLLVGAMIGFYQRVSNPGDILLIQAREPRR